MASNINDVGLIDEGQFFHGTYVCIVTKESPSSPPTVKGLAVHCWNTYITVLKEDSVDIKLLADAVQLAAKTSNRIIGGFMGYEETVVKLLDQMKMKDREIAYSEIETMYQLDVKDMCKPKLIDHARPAKLEDRDTMIKWVIDFNREGLNRVWSEEKAAALVDTCLKQENRWVLTNNDGVMVAMSGVNASINGNIMIGAVYTPAIHRNNGYARAVVSAMIQGFADTKNIKRAYLFTNVPAAERAYQSIGFKPIGTFMMHNFKV